MEARVDEAGHQPRLDGVELPRHAVMETVGRWTTRYPDAGWMDLLALRATSGRWRAAELVSRVDADSVGDREVDSTDLAYFAWLLATVATTPEAQQSAYRVFRRALTHQDQPHVPQRVWNTWLQSAYLAGELDAADAGARRDQVHPDTWWAVHTDTMNPFVHPHASSLTTWLEQLSQPFAVGGAAPLALRAAEEATPFDRLTTTAAAPCDGPLISVVMPVFNPTASLHTSAASVLAQTWHNLELILVDDASTAGLDHLEAVAEMDSRVRLLRCQQNAGAYGARNRGLAMARGTLLTFQDADDYSHAQRLEHQAHRVLSDAGVVASLSRSVRASDRLMVTNIGYRLISFNLSSVMMRREEVLRRLGGYDAVRRGADTEFLDRLRHVFGPTALHRVEHALAVVQLTPNSLSRGEMGSIHRHIARESYMAAARGWRDASRVRGADPYVQPPARAPFPAPAHVSGRRSSGAVADIVLLAPIERGAAADIGPLAQALVDGGHHVAVKEFVGPGATLDRLRGVGPTLARLLASGRIQWLMPDEAVHTHLAVIHDPEAVLTMPGAVLAQVDAKHYLLVNAGRVDRAQVGAVDRHMRALLGRTGRWLPATAGQHRALSEVGAEAVLPDAFWHVPATRASSWRGVQFPVVGLISPRLLPYSLPDGGPLVPSDRRASVWSFGPHRSRAQGRPITRIRADAGAWPHFVSQLSIFIGHPLGSIGAPVLDAWAAGVLVVAPAAARPMVGTKALYIGEGQFPDMDTLIEHLVADPSPAEAAIADAAGFSRALTSPSAVQRTVAAIIDHLEAG